MLDHWYVTKLECAEIGPFWGPNLRANSSHNITVFLINATGSFHLPDIQIKSSLRIDCNKWSRPILGRLILTKTVTQPYILQTNSYKAFPVDFFVSEKMFIIYMLSSLWTFWKKNDKVNPNPADVVQRFGIFQKLNSKLLYFHLESAKLKILQVWLIYYNLPIA